MYVRTHTLKIHVHATLWCSSQRKQWYKSTQYALYYIIRIWCSCNYNVHDNCTCTFPENPACISCSFQPICIREWSYTYSCTAHVHTHTYTHTHTYIHTHTHTPPSAGTHETKSSLTTQDVEIPEQGISEMLQRERCMLAYMYKRRHHQNDNMYIHYTDLCLTEYIILVLSVHVHVIKDNAFYHLGTKLLTRKV